MKDLIALFTRNILIKTNIFSDSIENVELILKNNKIIHNLQGIRYLTNITNLENMTAGCLSKRLDFNVNPIVTNYYFGNQTIKAKAHELEIGLFFNKELAINELQNDKKLSTKNQNKINLFFKGALNKQTGVSSNVTKMIYNIGMLVKLKNDFTYNVLDLDCFFIKSLENTSHEYKKININNIEIPTLFENYIFLEYDFSLEYTFNDWNLKNDVKSYQDMKINNIKGIM